ncbi:MAG: transglycosylase SLT domain-containing protein [Acetobacteraceae bacterium]|nr:transglycosylase SLT domain-containing protein [Acetobacteraceae bacterium]
MVELHAVGAFRVAPRTRCFVQAPDAIHRCAAAKWRVTRSAPLADERTDPTVSRVIQRLRFMQWLRRSALFGLLWLAAAAPAPTPPADWTASQSALCQAAIAAAEKKYQLPPNILGSIAKVESGRPIGTLGHVEPWPWTIDADGLGLFLDSRAAAVTWARLGLQRGVHFMDLGCMQVDWQLHPDAFASLDQAFDPTANADYAARYLRSLYEEAHGDWNVAVGWYHSHTMDLAADYRDRVAAVGAGILSGIGGPEPLFQKAIRRGTLRLALAGGGTLVINIHRQPRGRAGQTMSRCRIARELAPLLASRPRGC